MTEITKIQPFNRRKHGFSRMQFVPSYQVRMPGFGLVDVFHLPVQGEIADLRASIGRLSGPVGRDLSGVDCSFLPNGARPHRNDEWGIKIFRHSSVPEDAWELMQRQRRARCRLVGPPVHRLCLIVLSPKYRCWGYETSLAETTHSLGKSWGWASNAIEPRLSKLFKTIDDLHGENTGLYKKCRVCIDFGSVH